MPETPKQEIKLFYCYAHEDKALRDKLQVNLSGLKRQYQLTNWYDREILPGEKWEEAIDTHLSTADVILLLISPHFVDSEYCDGKEMQRALQRHHAGNCCVIPILLRPTYWEDTPLSAIQMLPTDARPITSWSDRYEAFHDVARGIGTAIKAMLTARSHKTKEQWLHESYSLFELKRYQEALAVCEQAIRLDPNFADAYNNKGCTLGELKRYEEALAAFEQAIHLNPNDGDYCNKGHALGKLKRHEEALAAFEQAIHLNPNVADYYRGKGDALYCLKRHEEALAAYEQAIHLNPNDTVYYKSKDRTLNAFKRHEEAKQTHDKARQLIDKGKKQPLMEK